MKIIIVGAGELGRLLAATLCSEKHDVIIVDNLSEELERLRDKMDVMTVEGSCASVAVMKKAGAASADALIAVSGDEAANILSCQIASRLGVKHTMCRLYSSDCFSDEDSVNPESFGIWRTFSPPEECVRKIMDVLDNDILLEKIRFSNPDALMYVFEVTPSSILSGVRIKDIPLSSALETIRFAAILRNKQFLIPHGDTILVPGDKVYLAGHRVAVDSFFHWIASEDTAVHKVLITGATEIGESLAHKVVERGCEVVFVEKDTARGEKLLDTLPNGVMLINGDPTDEEVLEEAGVANCDIFVSAAADDEDNILSCIMAKRQGAKKVVTVTHKPEYIRIVPALDLIDSAFSATLVAVNSVLRQLESGATRLDAILQRFRAHLTEFRITKHSPLCGHRLQDSKLPASAVFALIFRGAEVISPSGGTIFQEGDIVVAIVTTDTEKELEPLFPSK